MSVLVATRAGNGRVMTTRHVSIINIISVISNSVTAVVFFLGLPLVCCSVIFVLIYFLVIVLVLFYQLFFSFSFVLVLQYFLF